MENPSIEPIEPQSTKTSNLKQSDFGDSAESRKGEGLNQSDESQNSSFFSEDAVSLEISESPDIVEALGQAARQLSFKTNENGQTQIEIHDGDGKLIREIPSDDIIQLRELLQKFNGHIFDETI